MLIGFSVSSRKRATSDRMVSGDAAESRRYAELGRELTAKIADEDDRKIMEADFATIGP